MAEYPGFLTPTQLDLCTRDVGLIVDALAIDVSVGGYVRSMRAGDQYWNGAVSKIATVTGEQSATVTSLVQLEALAQKIIANINIRDTIGTSQTAVVQVPNPALSNGQSAADNLTTAFDIIKYKITNGISMSNFEFATQLLRANQAFIQAEVLAYVRGLLPGITDVQQETCSRDVALILDAVATDLLGGGGVPAQATAMLYPKYYTVNTATPLVNNKGPIVPAPSVTSLSVRSGGIYATTGVPANGEITATRTAIEQLSTLCQGILSAQPNAVTAVSALFKAIVHYLVDTPSTAADRYGQASTLINDNRTFLQKEISAFVASQYSGLLNDSQAAYCERDVGFIVDALTTDIRQGGFYNSIHAARCYWQGLTSLIPGETAQTQAALDYLLTLVVSVITNVQIPAGQLYQTNVAQTLVTTLTSGAYSTDLVEAAFLMMKSIIDTSPTKGPAMQEYHTAAQLLRTNKASLQSQIRSWVVSNYPGLLKPDKLDLCTRDVGFLVDSVAGDITGAGGAPLPVTSDNETTITLDEITDYAPLDNEKVNFYQVSLASISSHQFEFVGAGTDINTCLPQLGGVPVQANEVVMRRGGRAYYTSTDHRGDFRIGPGLVINQNTGTLSGRVFAKSLFGLITPFVLSIEAGG